MRYHVNPETGTAGKCSALIACPFGGEDDHYASQSAAQRAFEASMGPAFALPSPTPEDFDRVRSDARALAASFLDDPDWLPPVDDPSKPDGIDEEEGYIETLEAFKDPSLSMGNCGVVAEAVHQFTEGEYAYVEIEVGGPHLNIHAANSFKDRLGREWIVDYTYSQIDPRAEWPHVSLREDWEATVRSAGWRSPDEVRNEYANVEDTSYKMLHQPDEDGAQAHDVESHYPDFYTHPEWYRTGDARADRETEAVLRRVKNDPEAEVILYRSVPEAAYSISPGNWVTLSKTYAESHGAESGPDGTDWPVVTMRAKAKDIRTPGDSINEWGYYPVDKGLLY